MIASGFDVSAPHVVARRPGAEDRHLGATATSIHDDGQRESRSPEPCHRHAHRRLRQRYGGSVPIADGHGDAHLYFVTFEPSGFIGPHRAGFGQLFFPVFGSGWVAGEDGERVPVSPGDGGYISRGELHSKGSDAGMTGLIVQVRNLEVSALVLEP